MWKAGLGRNVAVLLGLVGLVGVTPPTLAGAETDAERAQGAQIYSEFCSACHGRYGRGDGPLGKDLGRPLPDFTDSNRLAGRTDQQIATSLAAVSYGPMAAAGALKPETLVAAIAYIRTLSVPGKHVSVLAGRDIYNATCFQCHGMKGDGKGPVVQFLGGVQPRDFTAVTFVIDGREDELVHFISVGAAKAAHGSSYMPEWASRLSPQQILDTMEYLKTFKRPAH